MAEPTMDFSTLILGLSSAALGYMGIGRPDGEGPQCNLDLAAQNIEIISILKEKTQGNLTSDEERLIAQVLSDLQMKFVEASK